MNADNIALASNIFSTLSIIFYSIVYVPQFYTIYKNKSSDGVSCMTMLMYTQADILCLISSILLNLEKLVIIIGWYHAVIGILMVIFILTYRKKYEKREIYIVSLYILLNLSACAVITYYPNLSGGEIISWITTAIYITARIPQILMNYYNESTEDLSMIMYILTILGNASYIGLITVDNMMENLPWLISSIVTILMDFVVIFQYYQYRPSKQ